MIGLSSRKILWLGLGKGELNGRGLRSGDAVGIEWLLVEAMGMYEYGDGMLIDVGGGFVIGGYSSL